MEKSIIQEDLFGNQEQPVIENLLPKDGEVIVLPHFFSTAESDRYLDILLNTVDWQQDSMKFYGKTVNLPRLTAWFGDSSEDYSYSGINMKARPWTPELKEIK